jgi:hypothetical protein
MIQINLVRDLVQRQAFEVAIMSFSVLSDKGTTFFLASYVTTQVVGQTSSRIYDTTLQYETYRSHVKSLAVNPVTDHKKIKVDFIF